jgi:hypothetical protein
MDRGSGTISFMPATLLKFPRKRQRAAADPTRIRHKIHTTIQTLPLASMTAVEDRLGRTAGIRRPLAVALILNEVDALECAGDEIFEYGPYLADYDAAMLMLDGHLKRCVDKLPAEALGGMHRFLRHQLERHGERADERAIYEFAESHETLAEGLTS